MVGRNARTMRTILAVALLAPLAVFAANRTESRKISDFTAIDASGGVTLEVKRGATALTIDGAPEVIAAYVTEVKDGVLVIRRKKASWREAFSTHKVTVRVTTPTLTRFEASGGIEASLTDVVSGVFRAGLSGGVELRATGINADSVEIDASGGVQATLEGKAKSADVDVSGGVNLDAKGLVVTSAAIDASGGCDVKVHATKSVRGEASGGVNVDVYGNPKELAVDTSGAASVDLVN